MTSAQHLVIGSGAGGALTAALLAEAGEDVLVLEEGREVAPGAVAPFSPDQMALQYRDGGLTAALGRPAVAYAEGCCLGGGTEVNAGLYHLAGETTLDRWRRTHQVEGLTSAELAPHAAEVERALSVQRLPGDAPRASLALAEGAQALGWEALEVPRWYRYDDGVPVKQSMMRTYLPRATAAGARVRPGVRVKRLVLRGGRVAGAQTEHGLVTAEHVWVCAGAIGTPALLQRSAISRPGLGTRLQMHPTVKLAARFAEPLGSADEVPVHQVKPSGTDLTLGGSARRPGLVAVALADDWAANRRVADDWERMGVYYAAIRPAGHGRVRALPGVRAPLVTFALTRDDMGRLGEGLASLARLLLAAGAESLHPSARGGGAIVRDEEVERIPSLITRGGTSVMTVHLCSTAPLGEDVTRCPVDSYGRVRGIRGLRVNDASLLPDAPGMNPQGTVMAIAGRNVAYFLASR